MVNAAASMLNHNFAIDNISVSMEKPNASTVNKNDSKPNIDVSKTKETRFIASQPIFYNQFSTLSCIPLLASKIVKT
jgi:hypothetical protein